MAYLFSICHKDAKKVTYFSSRFSKKKKMKCSTRTSFKNYMGLFLTYPVSIKYEYKLNRGYSTFFPVLAIQAKLQFSSLNYEYSYLLSNISCQHIKIDQKSLIPESIIIAKMKNKSSFPVLKKMKLRKWPDLPNRHAHALHQLGMVSHKMSIRTIFGHKNKQIFQ